MPARIISLDLARRLRLSGLRIPSGPGIEYEVSEIGEIAREQNSLFERSDALDKQLFGMDPVYIPPEEEED